MGVVFAVLIFIGIFLSIFLPMGVSSYQKHNEDALKKPGATKGDWRKKVDLKIVTKPHSDAEKGDRRDK